MEDVGRRRAALPSFAKPPVVEVAVGVEFVPLPALNNLELIRTFQRWNDRYPKLREQPPLPPSPSVEGELATTIGISFSSGLTPVRYWMLNDDESTLLQVQHDRLVLNWRKLDDSAEYPRYEPMREELVTRWTSFSDMHEAIGPIQPIATEVTFVNRFAVPQEMVATSSALRARNPIDIPYATIVAERSQHIARLDQGFAPGPGQIVITGEPLENELQQLTVSTRVGLQSAPAQDLDTILAAMDAAHDVGVLSFTAMTTSQMHELWGREQ